VNVNPARDPHIPDGLQELAVPIDSLNPDPANARKHGDQNLEAVTRSLEKFGQRAPLVVQKSNLTIRAGNARWLAAKALGWKRIAALIVDDDDVTATAYAIADNRTAELAEWDPVALDALIESLKSSEHAIGDIGFTDEDLEDLLGDLPGKNPPPAEETLPVPEPPKEPTTKPGDLILFGAYLECDACGKRQDYDPARIGEQCCDG